MLITWDVMELLCSGEIMDRVLGPFWDHLFKGDVTLEALLRR